MKVSTRIIAGYGVLILLTLAVLSYQVWVIRQLDGINSKLSTLNVRYAQSDIELQYNQERVDEFAEKYYSIGDPVYKQLFRDADSNLESILTKLRSESISVLE